MKTLTTDKVAHIAVRSCIACRKKNAKSALLRLVRTPENQVEIDLRQKRPGRGCYLCRTKTCFETAWSRKQIRHHLGLPPPPDFLNSLLEQLHERS